MHSLLYYLCSLHLPGYLFSLYLPKCLKSKIRYFLATLSHFYCKDNTKYHPQQNTRLNRKFQPIFSGYLYRHKKR